MDLLNPFEGQPPIEFYFDGIRHYPTEVLLKSPWFTIGVGKRPDFNGFLVRNCNGKGAVTVLWSRDSNERLLIGLVLEKRPNLGPEPVWCIAGGNLELGESHKEAQIRELHEETGFDTSMAKELPGLPFVEDRVLYVADAKKGEGNHAYSLEVSLDMLEKDEREAVWKPKLGLIKHKAESEIRFFPWREAARMSPDALALAAISRLLAEISEVP